MPFHRRGRVPAARFTLALLFCAVVTLSASAQSVQVPNAGFERVKPGTNLPDGWETGIAPGTNATIQRDDTTSHSGHASVKITDRSKTAPYVFAFVRSSVLPVEPETTYELRLFARARNLEHCSVGVDLQTGDTFREPLPAGTYDWQPVTIEVATQPGQTSLTIHVVADGPTNALWIDDVSLSVSAHRRARLAEVTYPNDFPGMFPRPTGEVDRHLLVCDTTRIPAELIRPLAALQGIVNRNHPRLYLISRTTDPPGIDEKWLASMKERGYTDEEVRASDPVQIIRRFRTELSGLIVIDPELPGSINAAWMLAGLKNALPTSPETAATLSRALDLPVLMDLRGKWTRNVDAYRYVYDHHWSEMCHHVLAWQFPPSRRFSTQDYLVAFKVFQFWVSSPDDHEKGGDPKAEMDFAHEVLANTPGAIPMFGWVAGDEPGRAWLPEYAFSHLCSEYGKFIPGTDLNSNATVHSAIRLRGTDAVFRQKSRVPHARIALEPDKVYVTFSIMDGDGICVWQGWWRRIFADPNRGVVPLGYGMELCTVDVMPLVQRWYYENMTAADTFYALVYLNEPVFANRFRLEDRERIWARWLRYVDEHCRMLDLDGVELLWSGVRRPNLPPEGVLRRYTQSVANLNYIVAEIGRNTRAELPSDDCAYRLDDAVVFHTVNNIHTWGPDEALSRRTMEQENAHILAELKEYAPKRRPAFVNIVGPVWNYNPTWVLDLQRKMPPNHVLVSPGELARLFREYHKLPAPRVSRP